MRVWQFFGAIVLGLGSPAYAQDPSAAPPQISAQPAETSLAGAYLAARAAAMRNDYGPAADYYLRALGQAPSDSYLADSALVSLLSAGRMEDAASLSRAARAGGQPTDLTGLVTRAELARDGDWQGVIDIIKAERARDPDGPGQLLDALIEAWALMGAGRANDAITLFEKQAKLPGAEGLAKYNLALAAAYVGDFERAAELLGSGATADLLPAVVAHVQVLAQLDKRDEAMALLDALDVAEAEPTLADLGERLAKGDPISFDVVNDPRDGIAQVLLVFASAITIPEEPNPLSLIQARLALWMSPQMVDARLMVAQLLTQFGQLDAAEAEYAALSGDSPLRPMAQMARIEALILGDRLDEAEALARDLVTQAPELEAAWVTLGDLLRQTDRFKESIEAYDRAISLGPDEGWFLHFARGISHERAGNFDAAVSDFRIALERDPDNANILNYLGYSYVDRNENLTEALSLIERAVAAAPGDGYILDSLGWAHFRLGNYAEAVAPMEEAATLMSSDSLVNDHLGDVYWKVGRQREARIQWRRALSLEPETEAEAARIRAKLEEGLDAVLAREASSGTVIPAPPPAVNPTRNDAPAPVTNAP